MNNDLSLDLTKLKDRFKSDRLIISKKPNFIFGKNGTGKTTITDAIKEQFSGSHQVLIFKDFDGVTDNSRLNAIALGVENAEIQRKIDDIDKRILDYNKELLPSEDKKENLFHKAEKASLDYEKQQNKINAFFTKSAREITNSQRLGRTYDKNKFKKDIESNPVIYSKEELETNKKTLQDPKKDTIPKYDIPNLNNERLLGAVNEILSLKVNPATRIEELDRSPEKQEFAKEGLRIHGPEERCAFCGGIIDKERLDLLRNYFNKETEKIENRITKGLKIISEEIECTEHIKLLNENDYYSAFLDDVKNINADIKELKLSRINFLKTLLEALDNKRKELFTPSQPLKIKKPLSALPTIQKINKIITSHNTFAETIQKQKQHAEDILRLNEVRKKMDEFNYSEEDKKLAILKANLDKLNDEMNNLREKLAEERNNRTLLISQTKNEEEVAKRINSLLAANGVESFSLRLVNDEEGQLGQYKVLGYNNIERDVSQLSKGEKNIIGFLYFVLSLESNHDDDRPKIIVFDDPMTSNDDAMQYLMTSELQKIYENLNDDYFILLTHNGHFYVNARKPVSKFYKKYANYILLSDNIRTTINKITCEKEDLAVGYGNLWNDLRMLYDNNLTNQMVEHCRKICETFIKFNRLSSEDFYAKSMAASKLFNVNSHALDDFESEPNGKNKESIMKILKELFKANNAEDHFLNYWDESIG